MRIKLRKKLLQELVRHAESMEGILLFYELLELLEIDLFSAFGNLIKG
jgi:hypothetical protein